MIELELESGLSVMVSKRHYDFLKQLKTLKEKKIARKSMSHRAQLLADSLVSSHLLNRDDEFYYILPSYETRNTNMKLSEDSKRKLRVINNTLRREFGAKVKFDESISQRALKRIKSDVRAELRTLSESASPQTNPEYSQCLLILEAVDILMGVKKTVDIKHNKSNVFEQIDELESMWRKLKESAHGLKKGDSAMYMKNKVELVNVDGDSAWIKIPGQSGTMEVMTSQLSPVASGNSPSLTKGTKVKYMKYDAEVVNVKGDSAWIKIPGQSGTMEIPTSQLKVVNETVDKKLRMIESKLTQLKEQAYTESKEKEIAMMLREDAQQAELIMASKSLLDTVHGFQSKIGDLMNKDLDPFIERVRSVYGNDTADKIYSNIDESLMDLLESVKTTKSIFADVVSTLSGDESALESDLGSDEEEALPDLGKDDELPDLGDDEESDSDSLDDIGDLDMGDLDLGDSEEGFTRKEE